jgi:hypothetical protein
MPLRERVQPGDVLVVRDHTVWAWLIRLGARVEHAPHDWNHVAVFDHIDAAGTMWGFEGRPGGFGSRDLTAYFDDPYTLTNSAMTVGLDPAARATIHTVMQAMADSDVPYDWPAIAVDGINVVEPIWKIKGRWGELAPGHVVCSSGADWIYGQVGWPNPDADQFCTPWDWARLILDFHGNGKG